MLKLLLPLVLGMILLLIFLSLLAFLQAIYPQKILSTDTPYNFNLPFESVIFETEDHVRLHGWFIKSPDPKAKTLILLHGYPADKGDILSSRKFLYPTYNLFFFDFRTLGESGGKYSTVGKDEVLDLLAAIRYLKARGIMEVGVWGFSMGAAVAIMTTPKAPEIKALVAESSYARLDLLSEKQFNIPIIGPLIGYLTRFWGLLFLKADIRNVAPVNVLAKIDIPVLLIHSKQDQVIPFSHAELLFKEVKNNKNVQIIITEQGGHGMRLRETEESIKAFFAKSLAK